MAKPQTRPKSCNETWITLVGLATFLVALPFLRFTGFSLVDQAVLAMVAATAPVMALDLLVLKVHKRYSAGLEWSARRPINWERSAVKLFGLVATFVCLGVLYWAFREYAGAFYEPFWQLIRGYLPWAAAFAVPYFILVDSRMREPHDGYWHFAMAVLGRYDRVSRAVLAEHIRGWLIKAFFLPLMFVYLVKDIEIFNRMVVGLGDLDLVKFFDFAFHLLYTIDVLYAAAGYILMLRLVDAHLRWAEPTTLGWLAAIVCYQPFWGLIHANYLNYEVSGVLWGQWLAGAPVLKAVWGAAILFFLGVYTWATVQFGVRFSNLTHRGILTNGPYRFTKHPAYVSKNITWWLISVPWATSGDLALALKGCFLLLIINAIYFIRARTEERHLARDPVYAAYCDYIDRHGIFRWVGRAIPPLRYRPPPLTGAS